MEIIVPIFLIIFGPPILLFSTGLRKSKTNADKAKVYYILAVIYLIVAGGTCATILTRM